jgi:peptidoglycan-N-acetylglucosamine deacetylase
MEAQKTELYITTSWDDGHPLDLRVAELLDKYGLPATFYLPLVSKNPLLAHSQIREIRKKYEIGAHTITHCDLSRVDDRVARKEIAGCKEQLEQIIDAPCTAFCFPYGHFRRKHIKYVLEAGYRTARTTELMSTEVPRVRDGVAILATTAQAVPSTFGVYERNALKRLRLANLLRCLRYGTSDWVKITEALLTHMVKKGGVFHLWGHSWEVNDRAQWANVERAFALLAQFKQSAVFLPNGSFASLGSFPELSPVAVPLSKSYNLEDGMAVKNIAVKPNFLYEDSGLGARSGG